ncbi:MAG: tetratricopeptide repeat protein, partial [Acidobacteria bacterium]|nr:tetratricopeptide repeat protein [Acidobacteriota bacterium]
PLRRAVEVDPKNVGLRIELALALWENSLPSEAEQHAREAVAMAPSSGAPHRILGALLLWRGDYLEAAMSLDRAASLSEPGVALLLDLGRAWEGAARDAAGSSEEEAQLRRAEAAYREAVTQAPEHVEAVYGLAQVLRRLGREEEASAQMARYMELYRSQQTERREQSIEALRLGQRPPIQ